MRYALAFLVLLVIAPPASAQRIYALGPVKLYVDPTNGNDANPCTAIAPCLTASQASVRLCTLYDLNNQPSFIQVIGTGPITHLKENFYPCETVGNPRWPGSNNPVEDNPILLGDPTNPTAFVIDGGVQLVNTRKWSINGFTINNGALADFGSQLFLQNINFGTANVAMIAIWQSMIEIIGPITVSGQLGALAEPYYGGKVLVRAPWTITFLPGSGVSSAPIFVDQGGLFYCGGNTFVNLPVMTSYAVDGGGISTSGCPVGTVNTNPGGGYAPGWKN